MSIAFRDANGASITSGTSITVTKPSGLTVGDLMVASITTTDEAFSLAGWTEIVNEEHAGGSVALKLLWKIADSSDVAASDFTFTSGSTASIARVILAAYSGTSQALPVHASQSSQGSETSGTTHTASGVTTTADNCVILLFSTTFGTNTALDPLSTPAGYSPGEATGGSDAEQILWYKSLASAGPSGDPTVTVTTTDNVWDWIAVVVAIQESLSSNVSVIHQQHMGA